MVELIPFTATAHLQQGAALDARFGIGFDGLITSLVRSQAKINTGTRSGSELDGGAHQDVPAEVELPLARCMVGPWHWLTTTAYPLDWSGQPLPVSPDVHHIRYSHQREVAEQVARKIPQHVPFSQGRFRSRRLPVVVFPAPFVQFRGVGDVDAIRRLLEDCHSLGSHRRSGEGAILSWAVEEFPTMDKDLWGHTHMDATLGRPVPPACADRLHLDGPTGRAGIRPPYWHSVRQHHLVLPTYAKDTAHASSQD